VEECPQRALPVQLSMGRESVRIDMVELGVIRGESSVERMKLLISLTIFSGTTDAACVSFSSMDF